MLLTHQFTDPDPRCVTHPRWIPGSFSPLFEQFNTRGLPVTVSRPGGMIVGWVKQMKWRSGRCKVTWRTADGFRKMGFHLMPELVRLESFSHYTHTDYVGGSSTDSYQTGLHAYTILPVLA